jgi:hypothetical protein
VRRSVRPCPPERPQGATARVPGPTPLRLHSPHHEVDILGADEPGPHKLGHGATRALQALRVVGVARGDPTAQILRRGSVGTADGSLAALALSYRPDVVGNCAVTMMLAATAATKRYMAEVETVSSSQLTCSIRLRSTRLFGKR